MITNSLSTSLPTILSSNSKIIALETTLQQSILDFKELLIDLEQLHIEADNYKTQYMKQKEKCDSKTCSGASDLKKVIESKETIIQLVASALTRLSETKNWNILDEIFKIIFGETTTLSNPANNKNKETRKTAAIKEEFISPKQELHSSTEDLSFKDESVSEIEGTPTGRISPIILTKKLKTSMISMSETDKKKCPDNWSTPESKALKLTFTTPIRGKKNSTLRQSRLNVVKVKTTNVIDITSSPEFSGGTRCTRKDTDCNVQCIKKESIENDDTILPSPTSGPTNFTLFNSPIKFKKPPPLSLKSKAEKSKRPDQDAENKYIKTERNNTDVEETNKYVNNIKNNDSATFTQEDSINILHPKRLPTNMLKRSPVKPAPEDTTFFDTQASVSLLHHVHKLDDIHKQDTQMSPSKRPLAENINVTNIPHDDELQASLSLLQPDTRTNRPATETVKRKLMEPVEELYDEGRAPRTRAERRMLPGWACAQCIEFFSELHKDDPELMKKKINECSHHRGWRNPERPKTPPGYWNPRWNVPDDTEEFNRKNNVC